MNKLFYENRLIIYHNYNLNIINHFTVTVTHNVYLSFESQHINKYIIFLFSPHSKKLSKIFNKT